MYSSIYPPTHSSIHPFFYLLIHPFFNSSIHPSFTWSTYPFTLSFIHSSFYSLSFYWSYTKFQAEIWGNRMNHALSCSAKVCNPVGKRAMTESTLEGGKCPVESLIHILNKWVNKCCDGNGKGMSWVWRVVTTYVAQKGRDDFTEEGAISVSWALPVVNQIWKCGRMGCPRRRNNVYKRRRCKREPSFQ